MRNIAWFVPRSYSNLLRMAVDSDAVANKAAPIETALVFRCSGKSVRRFVDVAVIFSCSPVSSLSYPVLRPRKSPASQLGPSLARSAIDFGNFCGPPCSTEQQAGRVGPNAVNENS